MVGLERHQDHFNEANELLDEIQNNQDGKVISKEATKKIKFLRSEILETKSLKSLLCPSAVTKRQKKRAEASSSSTNFFSMFLDDYDDEEDRKDKNDDDEDDEDEDDDNVVDARHRASSGDEVDVQTILVWINENSCGCDEMTTDILRQISDELPTGTFMARRRMTKKKSPQPRQQDIKDKDDDDDDDDDDDFEDDGDAEDNEILRSLFEKVCENATIEIYKTK